VNKKETMKILCDAAKDDNLVDNFVDTIHKDTNIRITLSMSDIILNLEINNYKLNLDTIQDFCENNGDIVPGTFPW